MIRRRSFGLRNFQERGLISSSDPRVSQLGLPAPAWLVSYADLMTEVLCFFLILYALTAALNRDLQRAKKALEDVFRDQEGKQTVTMTKDSILISLQESPDRVFFDTGSEILRPEMKSALDAIAPTLRMLTAQGHEIMVEGHTDDVPIRTSRFASNWELSTARAASVVRYLTQELRIPLWSVSCSGYGENHPLVNNDTPEHRAMNRRVVFLIKSEVAGKSKHRFGTPFEGPVFSPAAVQ